MKVLFFLPFFFYNTLLAQQHIAQFALWQPRNGQTAAFETGYKKHLVWHQSNGDTWSWYGWYFISGPRYGQFLDATFGHAWRDFDHRVNPTGDGADNQLNVEPYADFKLAYKAAFLSTLSTGDSTVLQSKFLRMLTLEVSDMNEGAKLLAGLKRSYQDCRFLAYRLTDGGPVNQLILLLGFSNFELYGLSESLPEEIQRLESTLKLHTITGITSETLAYRADLSLLN